MICEACRAGRHDDCAFGECDCPERREQEAVEQQLRNLRTVDQRVSDAIFRTLLYAPSSVARTVNEAVGSETACLFVQQVIGALRSSKC
jgi:hypothetical protein